MICGTASSTALFRSAAHSPIAPLMNGLPGGEGQEERIR
jgi:hypothetical protein